MKAKFPFRPPVIQAPMAAGGDTPALVAAVSHAGGLGFVGAAYLSPEQIRETARAVGALTDRPFGINLFAPVAATPMDTDRAMQYIGPFYAELGLPAPSVPTATMLPFDDQLAAILETDASYFSFTFGLLPNDTIRAVRSRGIVAIGTATTVEEAVALERTGVDAVIAQGSEAGGHRGTFLGDFAAAEIGSMTLVPQVVDAVKIPVIAAGGIMDGRGIVAALALGATAVQMGTAFLTCDEAGAPEVYKQAILEAREDQTRVTRAFSGRSARGIVNRFMDEAERDAAAILPFPLQNALTRPLRIAAAKQGRAEFLSMWAGQGVRLARRQTAGELIRRLVDEMKAARQTTAARGSE